MNLVEAAWNGDLQAVKDALEAGADINQRNEMGWPALIGSAMNGHIDVVKYLLEKGADVNAENKGTTALMCAAMNGHVDAVKFLIKHDADVNAEDAKGNTVVKYATSRGQHEIVEILVEAGAEHYMIERA
jgi:serine/threonine-protein phosphatase 6 regulatory ankyrin repeat subunit B